jgi:hypothetical protein
MSQETFSRVVGNATFHLWPDLPRDIQEKILRSRLAPIMRFGITSPCFYMNVTHAQLTHPNPRRWRSKSGRARKGRPENSPIEDFVVEVHAGYAPHSSKTQGEAIDWAKNAGHTSPRGYASGGLTTKRKPERTPTPSHL